MIAEEKELGPNITVWYDLSGLPRKRSHGTKREWLWTKRSRYPNGEDACITSIQAIISTQGGTKLKITQKTISRERKALVMLLLITHCERITKVEISFNCLWWKTEKDETKVLSWFARWKRSFWDSTGSSGTVNMKGAIDQRRVQRGSHYRASSGNLCDGQ